jgi:hypothetical protein
VLVVKRPVKAAEIEIYRSHKGFAYGNAHGAGSG